MQNLKKKKKKISNTSLMEVLQWLKFPFKVNKNIVGADPQRFTQTL